MSEPPVGPSRRSVHITLRWDEIPMATGTAWFASLAGSLYLVTAKHNLTGRNVNSGRFLGSRQTGPNNLVVRGRRNSTEIGWVNATFPLLDDAWQPLWFEDPSNPVFDVAVLPIAPSDLLAIDPWIIDKPEPAFEPILNVTDDLFIPGFPRGFAYNIDMPVWTRATVASEPGVGYNSLPMFLVDARTTRGHSGAPVVLKPRINQSVAMVDGSLIEATTTDAWVAGLYSGRVDKKLNIGMVWRLGVVIDVIKKRSTRNDNGIVRWLAELNDPSLDS